MLAAFVFAAQLVGGVACPPAAISDQSVSEWSRNIAVIKSTQRDPPEAAPQVRNGRGLVVGWVPGEGGRPGHVWIAVPAHVVFGKESPVDTAPYRAGLQVRLLGDEKPRDLCESSRNPRPRQGTADLTFVCVQWSGVPLFTISMTAANVSVGDDLQLLRPDAKAEFHGAVAAIRSDETNPGDILTTFKGFETGSGAPVASAAGVVGLYLGSDETAAGGRVVSMRWIQANAQNFAAVPWQLVENEYYDCNRTRRVCTAIDHGIAPAALTFRSIFRPGSATVEPGACADLPAGKYELTGSPGTACEPRYITLHAAGEPLQLKLACAPILSGTWKTPRGDWFICLDNGLGGARCGGLPGLGNGQLDAVLSANGTRISLSGSFVDPAGGRHPASGTLSWAAGRLSGEIQREQEPPQTIELKREDAPP